MVSTRILRRPISARELEHTAGQNSLIFDVSAFGVLSDVSIGNGAILVQVSTPVLNQSMGVGSQMYSCSKLLDFGDGFEDLWREISNVSNFQRKNDSRSHQRIHEVRRRMLDHRYRRRQQ